MTHYKPIQQYDNYDGPDASLDISLFEYGLAWGKNEYCTQNGELHIIYGTVISDDNEYNEPLYTRFDHCHMTPKDYNELQLESWFDLDAVEQFIGGKLRPFPYDLDTMIAYHGSENILGCSYWEGFGILECEIVEYFKR